MFRNISRLLIVLAVAVAAVFVWESVRKFDLFKSTTRTEHAVVLEQVSTLGKLELIRYGFRDVVEHELVRKLLPNSKTLLIVQGEAIGCVDLSKIAEKDVQVQGDSLILTLPKPELCTYKIDHQRTKIYDTRFAMFNEQQLIGDAYKHAEEQLRKSALESGILEQTEKNAVMILKPMLEKISDKKVVLRFR